MNGPISQVVSFIIERNPTVGTLTWDDDLIDGRAIDSLAFVDFIFLLEELGGAPIDPEGIDVDDFRTLRLINQRFLSGR